MPEYLLVFDLDKIHEYVFSTGRLKEIRGGSELMREATEEKIIMDLLQAYTPEKIYIGGGAGKIIIKADNDEKAGKAAAILEEHVRRETVSGSLTAVVVPVENDFGRAVETADWMLRRRKNEKLSTWQLGMAPVTEFCQSCRIFPAEREYDHRHLCGTCIKKREKAVVLKEKREKLSELAELGQPPNYIGFIHCDGNRMGEHLKKIGGDRDKYTKFSDLVDRAVEKASKDALQEVYPQNSYRSSPYDIVLQGGDDLLLITTADGAMRTAVEFCRRFQAITKEGGHEVAMSAGVVIAHAHQPILQVQRSAAELLASAKRFSNWKRGQNQDSSASEVGAIDFHINTTSLLDSIKSLRRREYGFKCGVNGGTTAPHWRLRRPYTVDEMGALLKLLEKIKAGDPKQKIPPLPRNKLKEMYMIFFQSANRMQIELDLLLTAMRLQEGHKKWLFEEIPSVLMDNGKQSQSGKQSQFWQQRIHNHAPEYFAALPDLVEMYGFTKVGVRRFEDGED